MRKRAGRPAPTQDKPARRRTQLDTAEQPASPLPVDGAHFPAGHRLELTKRAAQFTSSDGSSHLISSASSPPCTCCVWSNACWVDAIPGATFVADIAVGGDPQPLLVELAGHDRQLDPAAAADVPRRGPAPPVPRARPDGEPPKPKTPEEQRRPTRRPTRRGASRAAGATATTRVPGRAGPGAARAGQRADLHDPRRPRRHRRLLPQPDVARPGADAPRSARPS